MSQPNRKKARTRAALQGNAQSWRSLFHGCGFFAHSLVYANEALNNTMRLSPVSLSNHSARATRPVNLMQEDNDNFNGIGNAIQYHNDDDSAIVDRSESMSSVQHTTRLQGGSSSSSSSSSCPLSPSPSLSLSLSSSSSSSSPSSSLFHFASSSTYSSSSVASPMNSQSSSDPFSRPVHPIEQGALWGAAMKLISPLRKLITSKLPVDDYFPPLKILPEREYISGAILALQLGHRIDYLKYRYDSMYVMQSLRGQTFCILPPVDVDNKGEISFEDSCMLQSLPNNHLKNLTVLYIPIAGKSKPICHAIYKLQQYLNQVTMLIIHVVRTRFRDCLFVFDLRHSDNRLSALLGAISAVERYEQDDNLDSILMAFVATSESNAILVEALVRVDGSSLPLRKGAENCSMIRWSLTEQIEHECLKIMANIHRLQYRYLDRLGPIENFQHLDSLVYQRDYLPEGGFRHERLSYICLEPCGMLSVDINFEELPNLQCLEIDGNLAQFTGTLFLGKNTRLKSIRISKIQQCVIDLQDHNFSLDLLYLCGFSGVFAGIGDIRIFQLVVVGLIDTGLLQYLNERAEKATYRSFAVKILNEISHGLFADIKVADVVKCIHLERDPSPQGPLSFSDLCLYLTFFEIGGCAVTITSSTFPRLRRMEMNYCAVTFVGTTFNPDSGIVSGKEFPELIEAKIRYGSMSILSMSSENGIFCHGVQRRYYFEAPKLRKLTLWRIQNLENIYLDSLSCAQLKRFKWYGNDYRFLPFNFMDVADPIFPKLKELTLYRALKESVVDCGHLASRLSISQVTLLSLQGSSFINQLDQMPLSCRFAEISHDIAWVTWQIRAGADNFQDSPDALALQNIVARQMSAIEVLNICGKFVDIANFKSVWSMEMSRANDTCRSREFANADEIKE